MTNIDLATLTDPKTKQMASLLSRMTGDVSEDVKFSRTQVNSMIEVFIPRFVTGCPGMPPDLTCDLQKPDEDSWVLTISRPKS